MTQAEKINTDFLIEALKLCNECDVQYQRSANQRLLVELCLLRISSINRKDIESSDKTFITQSQQNYQVKSKLDRKMGYLTTVNEARKFLEIIYNKSTKEN